VRERASAAKASRAAEEDEEGEEEEEMDEGEVLKSMGKGPFTAEEIRRQRRMLSNRESARRSRRRKLEHVHTLQSQIDALQAEGAAVVERLREAEQRANALLRENMGLRAEVERLGGSQPGLGAGGAPRPVRGGGRAGPMPRIPSSELLAKRLRESGPGDGGDDPSGAPLFATDSPRGFVPFSSLKSYEDLRKLAMGGGGEVEGR